MVTVVEAATALVLTVNVALVAPAATVTLEGTLAAVVLLLESVTCAPPVGAASSSVTVPVEEFPPVTLGGFKEIEERETDEGAEDSSKCKTAGLGSFSETATNLEGEIIYMTAFPPVPEVTVMVPRPLVGEGEREYVAWKAAPETGPLRAPMSSVPVRLPVGLVPSAANSPEKAVTANVAG